MMNYSDFFSIFCTILTVVAAVWMVIKCIIMDFRAVQNDLKKIPKIKQQMVRLLENRKKGNKNESSENQRDSELR